MATDIVIINRALQKLGTRTTVTAAEYANQTTNEAIQAALIFDDIRDSLLRMAPWDFSIKTANLVYITSVPGTPENQSGATALWEPGQPPPPWAYEYQYPVDCLRALWVIPANQTGSGDGVPITTAVTGGAPAFWNGPPVKFKIQNDTFYPVTAAAVVAAGTGFQVGDIITLLDRAAVTTAPPGAPVQLRVATVAGSAIATVTVVNQIMGAATPLGGSYFAPTSATIAQDTVHRNGVAITTATGATFTLTFTTPYSQRVVLTNQQNPTLAYVKQVTDPNLMDSLFQSAWTSALAAGLAMGLTGDKALANGLVGQTNRDILEARKADGNEGMTVNDHTPDWIRVRGWGDPSMVSGPFSQFDWGNLWPLY